MIDAIEFMFGISLFINAVLFIPQIIILLRTKTARGVSLMTFLGFCGIQIFTILHGYIKKDFILMWGYVLSLMTCGTATYFIIYYKKRNF